MINNSLMKLVVLFGLSAGLVASTTAAPEVKHSAQYVATQTGLRDLWVEHVFWVRNYVLGLHENNLKIAKVSETETVANARTIANSIKPYYGEEAADKLFDLLAGHWGAVKGYAVAALNGDDNGADTALEDLKTNAGEIAGFLSGANPFLPKDTLVSLLSVHGSHHVSQIHQIDAGDFAAEAGTWHAMREHMLVIADALTEGLAAHFPERF